MSDNEECHCLNGKNCCQCGNILVEKEELIPRVDPYSADICNDHSEHLLCYVCVCTSAEDI